MRGSEFLQAFGSKSPAAWEQAALTFAKTGDLVLWPLVKVTIREDGHVLDLQVASDYLAVGTPTDAFRLPLTPLTAQKIADVFGMVLPTPKLVKAIHEQAPVRPLPIPMVPNHYANLAQYAAHNDRVQAAIASAGGRIGDLTSGTKKDVVMGNQYRPGKVLIYGWMKPDVPPGTDAQPMATAPWRIQPYSPVHGEGYVDYSHGIRLLANDATLDGAPVKLTDVMTSPTLSKLVSDEGPLRTTRYAVPKGQGGIVPYVPSRPRIVDQGLAWVQETVLERKN